MLNLLAKFSIPQILLCIVLLAVAFKEVSDFLDWLRAKIRQHDKTKKKELTDEQKSEQRFKALETIMDKVVDSINELSNNVHILMDSDKDAIKAYITREHHYFCYQKGWIDDYSLDCLERRYQHYVEENGNSFIKQLMEEVRALPKQDPKDLKGE